MQLNKNIIIFKNITEGFMNLKYINSLAEIFDKKKELKDKFVFILENNASNEVNQAIMQMFNKLIGFNIFVAATHIVENDIYQNIISIIEEEL